MLLLLLACQDAPNEKDPETTETSTEAPAAIEVQGWSENEAIGIRGDSQGEPSAVALPDGSAIAAWMQLDRYSLNVTWSRSDGPGEPWSEPASIYRESAPYQNDPVLVAGGDYVYFFWLSVYGMGNAMTSHIYCVDSTDGGRTWSEKVQMDVGEEFNDRQWAYAAPDGRIVLEWDHFIGQSSENLLFTQSDGGCDGFSEPEEVASGYFLSGMPMITSDGRVLTTRNQYSRDAINLVVSEKTEDGWDDTAVFGFGYDGVHSDTTAVLDPESEEGEEWAREEQEELAERYERLFEREEETSWDAADFLLAEVGPVQPHAAPTGVRDGDFEGTYSPSIAELPDGRLALTTMAWEAGDTVADAWFIVTDLKGNDTALRLNQDAPGNPQMLSWLTQDAGGGLHTSWFDAREGDWRLYGASSLDAGETWSEYEIGDDSFTKGMSDSAATSWIGHFSALTHSDDHVLAVFGDSREGTAWIYAAWSE